MSLAAHAKWLHEGNNTLEVVVTNLPPPGGPGPVDLALSGLLETEQAECVD